MQTATRSEFIKTSRNIPIYLTQAETSKYVLASARMQTKVVLRLTLRPALYLRILCLHLGW